MRERFLNLIGIGFKKGCCKTNAPIRAIMGINSKKEFAMEN
ncbi:hypothetical protein HPHPH45_0539 [Helicobacter pylori Hp H-45]|uniref:Uncharacterized protein n=1 Tax=Helicobacter pylori Hp H-45 TaxID=992050 RepID=I9TGC6_HELPX|nr:hypothetical protein HPHPH45_0539 [Helicobacter pylori Hp H-45]